MRVGCFCYGGHSWQAEQLREPLLLAGIELKTCHEYPNADVPYSVEGIFDFIDSCDIIILPARHHIEPCKSVNRLALAWSRKKPCIAYPLDAYKRYAVYKFGSPDENILFVNNADEMLAAIKNLAKDTKLRTKLANNGYTKALQNLDPRNQVDHFFQALSDIKIGTPWKPDTFVQIIIPHYAERTDYIYQAAKAALLSEGPARSVSIISSSKKDPSEDLSTLRETSQYELKIHHHKSRLSFAEANNLGLSWAHQKTTHFLLLNDDTIMGKDALATMFEELGDQKIILNPYSNCDFGWLHADRLACSDGKQLVPDMKIEDMSEDHLKEIYDYSNRASTEGLQSTKFCAMYCTLFSKEIYDRVGDLNTGFKNGGEDADWCFRAKRLKIQSYWTRRAWVFHFGGKTRKFAENEDFTAFHDEDIKNNSLLARRWPVAKDAKVVGIWTGPAFEQWDLDSPKHKGIGGSETCAAMLAKIMAKAGHRVYMYGEHEYKEQYDVQLVPYQHFKPKEEYFDLFISSRTLAPVTDDLKAGRILAWIHDIWLMSGQQISPYHQSRVHFICLSPWHKQFVMQHHNLKEEQISIIPNGYVSELFDGKVDEKQYGKMIYSSSPDRGLDNLLYMLPFIKDKIPEVSLDIYYGFFNWESAARNRNSTQELNRIESLKEQIEQAKDYVTLHNRVTQPELAKKWKEAYLWLYPTLFTETFCITAKEAQASATPVLCSNVAALQSTVGSHGYRVQHHPYSLEGRNEFVNKAIHILSDKDEWAKMSELARKGVEGFSWSDVYEKYWDEWVLGKVRR